MFPKSRNGFPEMSVESATEYVRTMVQRESRGPGDIENAMQRLETRYGLPFWTLWHLRKGRAKTCDTSLFARIRGAYLDMCQQQVGSLLHEIQVEAAIGDDTLEDLEARVRVLQAEIKAKKEAKCR